MRGRGVAVVASVAALWVGAGPVQGDGDDGAGGGEDVRREVLEAHTAAIEAERESLAALNPEHPRVAETHTGAALVWWRSSVETARIQPSDAFLFEPPISNEVLAVEVTELDGVELAFLSVCQVEQGEMRRGSSFEPEPDPDPAHRNTALGANVMVRVDGAWKLGVYMQATASELGVLGCAAD